ncbi:hypothetical protein, partial [Pelotomaculum propionicicum]|uniref:hypothetical protein n=1 Tax=Pelotomaculum propionicicum TaxID=258475 RepID=UPI0019617FBC
MFSKGPGQIASGPVINCVGQDKSPAVKCQAPFSRKLENILSWESKKGNKKLIPDTQLVITGQPRRRSLIGGDQP